MAHFEVFILNYNGAHFLPACLESLRSVELGTHSIHVNVIDNASTDNSQSLVRREFPECSYFALEENYGFSKGNNLGVQRRLANRLPTEPDPDFLVFLNNDTVVDKSWLLGAADAFIKDPSVGIVGSKSLFLDPFVFIDIESPAYVPQDFGSSDTRSLGVFLQNSFIGENVYTELKRTKLLNAHPLETRGTWLKPTASVCCAIKDPSKPAQFSFTLENHNAGQSEILVRISTNQSSSKSKEIKVRWNEPETVTLSFSPVDYKNVVQNAGSYLTANWEGGDRGFLEIDQQQYDQEEQVDAICGVSLFIRSALWSKLGGFDEHFFAYYEDTDLSLRARLLGNQCVYAPRSSIRHVHCGSGVEFSDYFNRNVAYSHLIFSSKFLPRKAWKEKLEQVRERARPEFNEFLNDFTLEWKPNLRAYLRYLKNFAAFAKNRIFCFLNRPASKLKPMTSDGKR